MGCNRNPEQRARDRIDDQLAACGWLVQDKKAINLHAGTGVAVRKYLTGAGPADYVLFVEGQPVGILEAKKKEEGVQLTVHEDQSQDYASSKLKYLDNEPLPFVYESTGEVTRFTDYRDPRPRFSNVFTRHRPITFRKWMKQPKTLRGRMHDLLILPAKGPRAIESRLGVADKLGETISNSIQQAEVLRQSILKKAFEGKLIIENKSFR